jgi:hypothetical protein
MKKKLTSVFYDHKSPARTARLLVEGDDNNDDGNGNDNNHNVSGRGLGPTPLTPLSPEEQAEVVHTLKVLQLYRAARAEEEARVEKIDLSKTEDVLDRLRRAAEYDAESVSSEADKLNDDWRATLGSDSRHEYEAKVGHFFSEHGTDRLKGQDDDDDDDEDEDDSVSISSASSSDVSSVF